MSKKNPYQKGRYDDLFEISERYGKKTISDMAFSISIPSIPSLFKYIYIKILISKEVYTRVYIKGKRFSLLGGMAVWTV